MRSWIARWSCSTESLLGRWAEGRWVPFIRLFDWRLTVGIGKIALLNGRIPLEWQRPAAHTVSEVQVALELDPRHWKIGRTHTYYDGPHDTLDLGPIQFYWDHVWCTGCYPDED